MGRGDGRKDSADRLMPPQAAGMSCYSVAEEIMPGRPDFLVELRGFEPLTSAMRSRRRPGVAAPGRCSRQPRARSAFRDPCRHLGLRRIAKRSWKFFVLRAIGRLDDRTAHSADPVVDYPNPLISVSVAVRLGVVAAARRSGLTDRVISSFAASGFSPTTQRRALPGATDAAQPSERMISR